MYSLLASAYKIALYPDRILDYLEGRDVQPVLLELGVTTRCNRTCPDCPSGLGEPGLELDLDIIDRLFQMLSGQTPGLIITGGEPTCHTRIVDILDLAGSAGFKEIALVTNGSNLGDDDIKCALLRDASAVRISYYDDGQAGGDETLARIRGLREEIDRTESKLEIGVSVLTSESALRLEDIASSIRQAGAHWLYFHPTCLRSVDGLQMKSQAEMIRRIEKLRDLYAGQFPIFALPERYSEHGLYFNGYHAAHFIWVVGADGINYAGTESKYRPEYALTDMKIFCNTEVERAERSKRIAAIVSENYDPLGSRNRGSLYSDLLQRLIDGKIRLDDLEDKNSSMQFHMPAII